MATVYDIGGDDDSPRADQARSSPIRVSWRDKHGADHVYVFQGNSELRERVAALARLN